MGDEELAATADSIILDACSSWFNLGREVIARKVPEPASSRSVPQGRAVAVPGAPGRDLPHGHGTISSPFTSTCVWNVPKASSTKMKLIRSPQK